MSRPMVLAVLGRLRDSAITSDTSARHTIGMMLAIDS
jgi:hypothetical protein